MYSTYTVYYVSFHLADLPEWGDTSVKGQGKFKTWKSGRSLQGSHPKCQEPVNAESGVTGAAVKQITMSEVLILDIRYWILAFCIFDIG